MMNCGFEASDDLDAFWAGDFPEHVGTKHLTIAQSGQDGGDLFAAFVQHPWVTSTMMQASLRSLAHLARVDSM